MADQQPQTEDWILFLSTVLGSVGMMATSDPMYYFYGLTVGAASKALLSLGPNWRSWEDWLLFAGAFLGALGSSLTSNSNYMLYGLVLGAVGKALPSLIQYHKSLEDWLLLVLPLTTGLVSALSSEPKFAMVGLFFGMIGKSLASVDPASATGTQPPPAATPPQASGLGGNRNYILWNNCIPLVNPSVTFTAGSDLRANGNWDLQVNAYAPSGADAYMQFVLAVTTAGEVQWSIENWPISGDNLFNTCDQPLFKLPSSFLPKGYSIGVKMNTDPNTINVTSLEFSVSDATGSSVARKTVPLNSTLPICSGSWKDAYLSQVIGFEPDVVGYNGGVAVSFSSRCTGSLACSADVISASYSIPACAETKAGTVEDSNMQYSIAVQASPSLVTISTSSS
ncbi:MAG: hypothetical protein OK441_04945 [Thaumarchaeota archaeon]|nr:hypothetical protein [Nitrososphaerota archaeon]